MLDDTWNGHDDLRRAFSRFATGVTVVTTQSPSLGEVGFTANSFSSVSLNPPLVLWSIANDAARHDTFTMAQDYAIHVLAHDQQDIADHFVHDGGGFQKFDWEKDDQGIPMLRGCLARLVCSRHEAIAAGDHTILIGRVTSLAQREGAALAYMNSRYGAVNCDEADGQSSGAKADKSDERTPSEGEAKE